MGNSSAKKRSKAVADPGFASRGEGNHGERAEREPTREFGDRAPSGVPGGGQGPKPLEAESFLSICIQKSGQKLRI